MPLFAFAFDEFESKNSHSMNSNFDKLRHITLGGHCHCTLFKYRYPWWWHKLQKNATWK